jgi:hypothetical protein
MDHKSSVYQQFNNFILFLKILLTIDPQVIIFPEIFNLFWLGPNGSRLFLYNQINYQGGDSYDLYND